MEYLIVISVAAALLALHFIDNQGWSISPDGQRYLALAKGIPLPSYFAGRIVLPRLLGTNIKAWAFTNYAALLGSVALMVAYLDHRMGLSNAAWGALLFCGLSGVFAFAARHPVLIDPVGMFLALAAAVCIDHDWWWVAVPVSLLAGMVNEKAPVYGALFAWNPLPLIGLIPRAIIQWRVPKGNDILDEHNAEVLAHPIAASMAYHRNKWFDAIAMAAPWGVCLAALGGDITWQFVVTLGVAYGTMLFNTDTVRIYQWAAPVMIATAVPVLSPLIWLPVLAVHLVNPWRGSGA